MNKSKGFCMYSSAEYSSYNHVFRTIWAAMCLCCYISIICLFCL